VSARPEAPKLCSCQKKAARGCPPFGCFCLVPFDVTLVVLSRLCARDLLAGMGLLNNRWRKLVTSAELWRPLCLERWPELEYLTQDKIGDWLVVYTLWHSGKPSDVLRLIRMCPLTTSPPTMARLTIWHDWWKMFRRFNTCPHGGVESFRRTPLCHMQEYDPNPVMELAFERCRHALLHKHRCKIYTHELFIAVTKAELRQLELHGFWPINTRMTCRPGPSLPEVEETESFDEFLQRFWRRLEIVSSGTYQPAADELVANVDTPGVYAFWYNPARAIEHRAVGATHLLCLGVLMPHNSPHVKAYTTPNVSLTYSLSPLSRESVRPKWWAEIGTPYNDPNLGWAMLEYEWGHPLLERQEQALLEQSADAPADDVAQPAPSPPRMPHPPPEDVPVPPEAEAMGNLMAALYAGLPSEPPPPPPPAGASAP